MTELLQTLLRLQALDFEEIEEKDPETAIAALRAKIPAQILGHYDRLVVRGKKGVALVRGQVCTGCHMTVPLGTIMTLKHGDDIQLCENCGRYLHLAEAEQVEPVVETKPKKSRRPKKSSLAA